MNPKEGQPVENYCVMITIAVRSAVHHEDVLVMYVTAAVTVQQSY